MEKERRYVSYATLILLIIHLFLNMAIAHNTWKSRQPPPQTIMIIRDLGDGKATVEKFIPQE